MSRAFELLIFDWDGTLMDTLADVVTALTTAADEQGLSVAESAIREVIGSGNEAVAARLFPGLPLVQQQQILQRYTELYYANTCLEEALFAGARETLATLSAAGYQLAVATGKSRAGLDKALAATDTAHFFAMTRCADESFAKPHPAMIEQILAELDVPASNALMIGDTTHDMQLAANANLAVCAMSYGVHSKEELLKYNPEACLAGIVQLPEWLESRDA